MSMKISNDIIGNGYIYIYVCVCVCVCVCACARLLARRLYMNYRCYYIILRVKHFYASRERCKVLTGYLSQECRSGGDLANALTLDKTF